MKYIDDFRDPKLAKALVEKIHKTIDPKRQYRFMEFCGGHTHAIFRYGITDLLPSNIKMIHGPGCPVCVLPIAKVDYAIVLAKQDNVIFCSYADMLRVPGSKKDSLLKAKAAGADVRMVYSVDGALEIAIANPDKKVIFFAIGFETTTPPTAFAALQAQKLNLNNFFIFCNHVLTPIAMEAILTSDVEVALDGFVGPSHVSVVIGSNAYHEVAKKYNKPVVVAGFEPLDILQSILMLIEMVNNAETGVENQYSRAVTYKGNIAAQDMIAKVFSLRENFEWRGLGFIPDSALKLKDDFAFLDAEKQFSVITPDSKEHKGCACADILRGLKEPEECKLFAIACNPQNPLGACMISSEGACSAHYQYRYKGIEANSKIEKVTA